MDTKFTIRVYGLLIDSGRVLLSDELIKGNEFTKFPGGGLEFGEGIIDCLRRELREEMNIEVEALEHFYTTDFFQSSAFNKNHQVISIYYLVRSFPVKKIEVKEKAFDFEYRNEGAQVFRWKAINELAENDLHFPIDKIVVQLLCEKYSGI